MRSTDDANGFRLEVRKGKKKEWFERAEAERLAGQIIPAMNRMGGKKHTVQAAVGEIEHHGHPDEFLADVITGNRFADKEGCPGLHQQDAGADAARAGDRGHFRQSSASNRNG